MQKRMLKCIRSTNPWRFQPHVRCLKAEQAWWCVQSKHAPLISSFLFFLNKKIPPISLPNFKKISLGQAFVGNQHCTALQNLRSEARERRHPSCQKLTVDSRMWNQEKYCKRKPPIQFPFAPPPTGKRFHRDEQVKGMVVCRKNYRPISSSVRPGLIAPETIQKLSNGELIKNRKDLTKSKVRIYAQLMNFLFFKF